MPFRFWSVHVTLERKMNIILSPVEWKFDVVYQHNIAIFSESNEQHIGHACNVMKLLQNANVTHTFINGNSFAECFDYFGQVICTHLEMDSYITQAIPRLQTTTSRLEL